MPLLKFLRPVPRIKRLAELQARHQQAVESEAQFLSGRHSRIYEYGRVVRIGLEFLRGFRALRKLGPAVTVFGSARFREGHPYYDLARRVGAGLGR
ncbi:MAG: hypothetical protein ACXVBW_11965, partial [Bdellovibrionota bacterium]